MQSKQQAFIVYDSKADDRTLPMFSPNQETMLRDLRGPCNNKDHQWHRHAMDYHLFKIGDVDLDSSDPIKGHPEQHITSLLALVDDFEGFESLDEGPKADLREMISHTERK